MTDFTPEQEKALLTNLVNGLLENIEHAEKVLATVNLDDYCLYNSVTEVYKSEHSEYGCWPNPEMADRFTKSQADRLEGRYKMQRGRLESWALVDAIQHQIEQTKLKREMYKNKLENLS